MDECSDCGAKRLGWLGGPHKCHAKFVRRKHNGREMVDTIEPHSVEEFEEGYLATGNQFFQFASGLP